MEADDPRLVASLESLTDRVRKLDDFIVTVLKYHVSVEQSMTELIEAYGNNADDTFFQKIIQCENLKIPEIDVAVWNLLKKANRLRNAIAHHIHGPDVKHAMEETREAYTALSAQSAKDAKKMTDTQLAMSSFMYCGSYIVVASDSKLAADKHKAAKA